MKTFPKDLINAFNSDEVVCICGSGPSVAAGYPGWGKLLELMITECENQLVGFQHSKELRALLKQGHFLEVADECSKLLAGQLYRDFFQRIFREPSVHPSKLHEVIAQLPFSAILTTNYDNLLERAYFGRFSTDLYPLVYTQKNLAQLPRLASERRFFIFKMHGDADDVQTIVLTKRDYQELIHNNDLYRTALGQILATKTALFIGYGLRDHDLNFILGEHATLFKSYGRRHYAFLPDPGTILPKSLSENYNVTVIPYSGRQHHAELEELLSQLRATVKNINRPQEAVEFRKLKQLMDMEREYCQKLGTDIEFTRACFLRDQAWELLESADRNLVSSSIEAWNKKESSRSALESQLRQSQKMEAVGQLAAGIAHDFNNILTVISTYAAMSLSTHASADEKNAFLEQIKNSVERGADLIRRVLGFSRRRTMQHTTVDVNDLLGNISKLLQRTLGEDITLELSYSDETPVIPGDVAMIEQVILNLVINARDAMPTGGKLILQAETVTIGNDYLTKNSDARLGNFVRLNVTDSGCGIAPEILGRIFEPFFTTKDIGKGTGLGLATVYGIVKQHKGWIEVFSEVGKGSTFQVYFPEGKVSQNKYEEKLEIKDLRGSERVLLVEDEPALIKLESEILRSYGYSVIIARNGPEALNRWHDSKGNFDLLVTDMVMPNGMSGYELSLILTKEKPALKVLYVSGYSTSLVGAKELDLLDNFLSKPFAPGKLLTAIRTILDTGRSKNPTD